MNTVLHIRARRSEAATTSAENIQPTGVLGSLQWMPPGKSTISASVNGAPKKVDVTANEKTAQLVDRRIKEMIAQAHGGNAGLPYIDFDHSDGEAAAWPQSASWGGNDPLTGGVRINVEWSEVGRAKVRGKSYQGFSPEFMLGTDGTVSDIGLNLGGLVNRPAFTGIQRVTAHASAETYSAENKTEKPERHLLAKAARVRAERGVSDLVTAMHIAAIENPDLYDAYRGSLVEGASPVRIKPLLVKPDASEFIVQAKKIASDRSMDPIEAMLFLGRERPELYDQYRDSLGLIEAAPMRVKSKNLSTSEEKTIKAQAVAEATELVILAKNRSIETRTELSEATMIIARERPELYQQYVDSLGLSEPAPVIVLAKASTATDGHELLVKAQALADSENIGAVEAMIRAAHLEPQLYEDYRATLRKKS